MKAIKDYFSSVEIELFATRFSEVDSDFNSSRFVKKAKHNLEKLEYRERVVQISDALMAEYKSDFLRFHPISIKVLEKWLKKKGDLHSDFCVEVLSKCIEEYGVDHPKEAFDQMAILTQIFSAEWCIRPYVDLHFDTIKPILKKWKKSDNEHWRRLVSEGLRPNLPWGKALQKHKNEPLFSLPWLEGLSCDESEYVRRSVANHINDITKKHPKEALSLLRSWRISKSKKISDKDLRHALRGLIKSGNQEALAMIGVKRFEGRLSVLQYTESLVLGETAFIDIELESEVNQKIELDLKIDFPAKQSDKKRTMILKGLKKELTKGKSQHQLKVPIRHVTTRVYYPGIFSVFLQINGSVVDECAFELKE